MQRYSFSGKGNIIIKAAVTTKYNGVSYEVGEPIAYFTNVFANLNFQYLEKTPKVAIENLAVDSKSSPSYLQISNIKINESLQSLLYKKQTYQKKQRTFVKNLVSEDESLFLPIQNGETVLNQIFIYDNNKNRKSDFVLNQSTGEITGLIDGSYIIFYSIDSSADAVYSLEAPQFPYMSIELHIDGNLDGNTGMAVIHLNKVQLLTRPSLDMNSETPFVDDLDFVILQGDFAEVDYYAS